MFEFENYIGIPSLANAVSDLDKGLYANTRGVFDPAKAPLRLVELAQRILHTYRWSDIFKEMSGRGHRIGDNTIMFMEYRREQNGKAPAGAMWIVRGSTGEADAYVAGFEYFKDAIRDAFEAREAHLVPYIELEQAE